MKEEVETIRAEKLYIVSSNTEGLCLITGSEEAIQKIVKSTEAYNKNKKNQFKQKRTLVVKDFDTQEVVATYAC